MLRHLKYYSSENAPKTDIEDDTQDPNKIFETMKQGTASIHVDAIFSVCLKRNKILT